MKVKRYLEAASTRNGTNTNFRFNAAMSISVKHKKVICMHTTIAKWQEGMLKIRVDLLNQN